MCIHTYLCGCIYELSIQVPDQVDGWGGGGSRRGRGTILVFVQYTGGLSWTLISFLSHFLFKIVSAPMFYIKYVKHHCLDLCNKQW